MGPPCAVSFTDVAGSNRATCPRVSGPGWKLQVGSIASIEEWFLVAVELGGVLNSIQQLLRTSHTGVWRSWFFDLNIEVHRNVLEGHRGWERGKRRAPP